jgi:D-alanyl-lipoteichoic acid acyltransferase DltB (MBOAT superfamily)
MLFQTVEFLILLIVVLVAIMVIKRRSWQHGMLTAASFVFYGWWDVRFLLLIVLSTVVDYSAAMGIVKSKLMTAKRRTMLSFLLIGAAVFFLLPNWPEWQAALKSGSMPAAGTPWIARWSGLFPSIGFVVAIAILGPLTYALWARLADKSRRRAFLLTSVLVNLGVLAFFKYFNFFMDSAQSVAGSLGSNLSVTALEVALPVGISFYTFQTMSYTIDVYRGQLRPEKSLLRLGLYVSYFPQLVAGPILRPKEFLPSLRRRWVLRVGNLRSGFNLALVGLFKKVIIADNLAPLVDVIFSHPEGQSSIVIMLGAMLFAIQIYCDFSGYTDIARAISRMFGVEIPINFNFPYFSTSMTQFWRRWHISLSSWLRDYLYIPLGGSRISIPMTYVNLMITMLLGGLWHGASWNFVVWGGYQGALLAGNKLLAVWTGRTAWLSRWSTHWTGLVVRWGITTYLWLLGWLIFRVTDFSDLWYCVKKFVLFDGALGLGAAGLGRGDPFTAVGAAAVFCVLHAADYLLLCRTGSTIATRLGSVPYLVRASVYVLAAVAFFFAWPTENGAFIYFQF